MSQYTELLDLKALSISPDDDDYEEKLLEVAQLFRTFDDALTTFLIDHGYTGDASSIDDRVKFLETKFNHSKISVDKRTIKNWFVKHIRIKLETAFQICFAFNLDIEQTNDFFRRVCLERGFDCHTKEGAVYYYCFRNGSSYEEAQKMLARTLEKKQGKIPSDYEVLYTQTIVDYLENVDNQEDLIKYINDNIEQFGYNNVTGAKYIKEFWSEIAGESGLAYEEGKLLEDDFVTVFEETRSVWNVYCQILGIDKKQEEAFANDDRSIKCILRDNDLLHVLAEASFPDRDGIEKVINGHHISDERIRKILILLVFYSFWAKKVINWAKKTDFFEADNGDAERFLADVNKYLLESGYQVLYPGNPYDWIFMWALRIDDPLHAFRYYMGELSAFKSEQISIKI
jgi:hypothetical protein